MLRPTASLLLALALAGPLACQSEPRLEPLHVLEPWEAVAAAPPATTIAMPEDELTLVVVAPDGSRQVLVLVREGGAVAVHDADGTLLATAGPSPSR